MKKILTAILLLLNMGAMAQIKSAKLTASGLTCSMCSKAIYKALTAIPFVKEVTVDIDKSIYTIQFKEGEAVVLDDIKNAVTGAGFFVASMQVMATIDKTEIFDDAHVNLGGSTFHFMHVNKQVLQGDVALTMLDKNYLPKATYNKNRQYTKMKCYETGYMGSCCPKDKTLQNRIYHVTL
jgi:copper chaperone CopZ